MSSDYPSRLKEINIELLSTFTKAKDHHDLKCLNCQHEWTATPISKIQAFKKRGTNGCPNCHAIKRDDVYESSRNSIIKRIEDKGIEILSDNYKGEQTTLDKINVKFTKCGHETQIAPGNIVHNNAGCLICANEIRAIQNRIRNQEKHIKWRENASEWQVYRSVVNQITQQNYKLHKDTINPLNHPIGISGELGNYHIDHIVSAKVGFVLDIPPEEISNVDNLQMLPWEINNYHHDNIKGIFPGKLQHYTPNKNLIEFLQTFNVSKPIFNFKANNVFELSKTVCVIFADQTHLSPNWQLGSSRRKVFNQRKELLKHYNRVLVIFEDEWIDRKEQVITKINHIIHSNPQPSIHARKCIIKDISSKEKNIFLNKYHLQGSDKAKVRLGAFYNNELVAVMTFCIPRVGIGKVKDSVEGTWELSRFVTNTNYRIPGIASKLLKHFQRTNQWLEIYSYADMRWSDGNVYEQLGFELETINPPGYWYTNGIVRKHRWGFRKDALKHLPRYDKSKTEYQNVSKLMPEYQRIYDCGTMKFTLKS